MKKFWDKVISYVSQRRMRITVFIWLLYLLLVIIVIVIPGYLYNLMLEVTFPYMEDTYLNFYLPYIIFVFFVFRHYHIKYLLQIRLDLLDRYNDIKN